MCWNANTCAAGSNYYLDSVQPWNSPEFQDGIFDLANADNPFREYSILYIPYCTGDLHWGNQVQIYQESDGTQNRIAHKGFINATAALDYAFEQIQNPETVFVTGCSAGSVGSILHTPYIIKRFPNTSVVQLGDSLVFNYPRPMNLQETYGAYDNFPQWIPELFMIPPEKFDMLDFYSAVAMYYPANTFAQFNYTHDEVQAFFYGQLGGDPDNFSQDLQSDLNAIRERAPNFASYEAEGKDHCIMPLESFYTLENSEIRFRDWVVKLINLANHP